jgi:hypothetical protein
MFRPYQIRRIAQAEADAEKTKAPSQIEITEIQHRAMYRLLAEEGKKQHNMETITQKAIPELKPDSKPENLEDDWVANFFEKCRLISDDNMQALWAKVLAGEANSPGQYSKWTVNILSSMDKNDAELFKTLCSFGWSMGELFPLIYDPNDSIYTNTGLNFAKLKHLDAIGLLSFDPISGFKIDGFPQGGITTYYGDRVQIEFPDATNNSLNVGHVMLSRAGVQLATVCGSTPCPGFMQYVIDKWKYFGLTVKVFASPNPFLKGPPPTAPPTPGPPPQ